MFVSEFACPCCGTVIRPANPNRVGRKVQCYACRTTFEVTVETVAEDTVPPKPPSLPPAYPVSVRQENWAEQPVYRTPRRSFRRKRQPNIGLMAFLITGSMALVLVVTIAVVAIWRSGSFRKLFTATGSPPSGWQQVVSAEGRFRVLMPGSPIQKRRTMPSPVGPVEDTAHVLENDNWSMLVSYADFDAGPLRDASLETIIAAGQTETLRVTKGRLVGKTSIKLQGRYGQEMQFDVPGQGTATMRWYLDNRRIYTLGILGTHSTPPADMVARFFDSFEITN